MSLAWKLELLSRIPDVEYDIGDTSVGEGPEDIIKGEVPLTVTK